MISSTGVDQDARELSYQPQPLDQILLNVLDGSGLDPQPTQMLSSPFLASHPECAPGPQSSFV